MRRFFSILIIGLCIFSTFAYARESNSISTRLNQAASSGEFTGVVMIQRHGKPVYQKAVGYSDRDKKSLNKVTTKFRISSITKQFTTVLLLKLVEQGKVSLDKPVATYVALPEVSSLSKVTTRHLLSGSSQLPWLENIQFYVGTDPQLKNSKYVIGKYLNGPLRGTPGSKFGYNNGDFIVAQAVIEAVTKRPFGEVLQSEILTPLGLKNTGLLIDDRTPMGLASGYTFLGGKFANERRQTIANYGAAGAMYSTAGDLSLWNDALLNSRLISASLTKEMFTADPKLGYVGLGSWVYKISASKEKKVTVVERQGGIGGFSAVNLLVPSEGLSVVILGNVKTGTLGQTYASRGLSFEVLRDAVLGPVK